MALSKPPVIGLSGQIIVVTGASGGIGQGLCAGLSRCGATVIGIDVKEPAAPLDGDATFVRADITSHADMTALADMLEREHGGVQALINNAAVIEENRIEDYTLEQWNRVLGVNLTGTFLCTKTIGALMIRRKQGKIVNIASRCGAMGYPFFVAYNVSKSGILALTRTLAVEWAVHNIQVNAVSPGFVRTPMNAAEFADPKRYRALASKIPAGRPSEPDDLVGTVAFFCSSASDYVTGTEVAVDGGTTAGGGAGGELLRNGLVARGALADADIADPPP